MIKNGLKIKDNITNNDIIDAVNFIVDANFINGEYTPYYYGPARLEAIAKFFITGYELEDGEKLIDLINEDEDMHLLIVRFFYKDDGDELDDEENAVNQKYINIFNDVLTYASQLIEFEKQKIINCTYSKEEMYGAINAALDAVIGAGEAVRNVVSGPENTKELFQVIYKLNKAKLLNKDVLTGVVVDAVKEINKGGYVNDNE